MFSLCGFLFCSWVSPLCFKAQKWVFFSSVSCLMGSLFSGFLLLFMSLFMNGSRLFSPFPFVCSAFFFFSDCFLWRVVTENACVEVLGGGYVFLGYMVLVWAVDWSFICWVGGFHLDFSPLFWKWISACLQEYTHSSTRSRSLSWFMLRIVGRESYIG